MFRKTLEYARIFQEWLDYLSLIFFRWIFLHYFKFPCINKCPSFLNIVGFLYWYDSVTFICTSECNIIVYYLQFFFYLIILSISDPRIVDSILIFFIRNDLVKEIYNKFFSFLVNQVRVQEGIPGAVKYIWWSLYIVKHVRYVKINSENRLTDLVHFESVRWIFIK